MVACSINKEGGLTSAFLVMDRYDFKSIIDAFSHNLYKQGVENFIHRDFEVRVEIKSGNLYPLGFYRPQINCVDNTVILLPEIL